MAVSGALNTLLVYCRIHIRKVLPPPCYTEIETIWKSSYKIDT